MYVYVCVCIYIYIHIDIQLIIIVIMIIITHILAQAVAAPGGRREHVAACAPFLVVVCLVCRYLLYVHKLYV